MKLSTSVLLLSTLSLTQARRIPHRRLVKDVETTPAPTDDVDDYVDDKAPPMKGGEMQGLMEEDPEMKEGDDDDGDDVELKEEPVKLTDDEGTDDGDDEPVKEEPLKATDDESDDTVEDETRSTDDAMSYDFGRPIPIDPIDVDDKDYDDDNTTSSRITPPSPEFQDLVDEKCQEYDCDGFDEEESCPTPKDRENTMTEEEESDDTPVTTPPAKGQEAKPASLTDDVDEEDEEEFETEPTKEKEDRNLQEKKEKKDPQELLACACCKGVTVEEIEGSGVDVSELAFLVGYDLREYTTSSLESGSGIVRVGGFAVGVLVVSAVLAYF